MALEKVDSSAGVLVHTETFRPRSALALPAHWGETVQRLGAALGISLEIWSGPSHHGQRLGLGPACAGCQLQEPRTFDRCRKRRAYLTRPEAPIPETLAEKCPQEVRLARSGPAASRREATLFAFGYEPRGDASQTDAAILTFLHDLGLLLQENTTGCDPGAREEAARFLRAAHDALPHPDEEAMASSGRVPESSLDLCRRSLNATAVFFWRRNAAAGALALDASEDAPPQEPWLSLCRTLMATMGSTGLAMQTQALPSEHPVARIFGQPLECHAQIVPGARPDEGILLVLHRPDSFQGSLPNRLQEWISLWSRQSALSRTARRAQDILSETLLALAMQREKDEQRGRTRRVRCLAMLLAGELDLLHEEMVALHWACLARGNSEGNLSGDGAAAARGTATAVDPIARALTGDDSPLGPACAQILERAGASRGSTQGARPSTDPTDLAGDCLIVAETFDELLSRGGSTRPRTIRAAVAFLEAGAGIAFDPVVVQALAALEGAFTRHAWIFLLGRHAC